MNDENWEVLNIISEDEEIKTLDNNNLKKSEIKSTTHKSESAKELNSRLYIRGKLFGLFIMILGFLIMVSTLMYNFVRYGKTVFSITVISNLGVVMSFVGLLVFLFLLMTEDID